MSELLEILDNHKISYNKTNNPSEILIKCTGGNHNDENPSLSYNLDSNIFHCWSCGFKGGKNKFLKSIGITTNLTLDTKQPYRILKVKQKNNLKDIERNMEKIVYHPDQHIKMAQELNNYD